MNFRKSNSKFLDNFSSNDKLIFSISPFTNVHVRTRTCTLYICTFKLDVHVHVLTCMSIYNAIHHPSTAR